MELLCILGILHTYRLQIAFKISPVGFDHFNHHVILEILNKVQHPLTKSKSRSVAIGRLQFENLGCLVGDPHTERRRVYYSFSKNRTDGAKWDSLAELPFHMLAIEEVPEEHLICNQGLRKTETNHAIWTMSNWNIWSGNSDIPFCSRQVTQATWLCSQMWRPPTQTDSDLLDQLGNLRIDRMWNALICSKVIIKGRGMCVMLKRNTFLQFGFNAQHLEEHGHQIIVQQVNPGKTNGKEQI